MYLNIIRVVLLLQIILLRLRINKSFIVLFCNSLVLKSNYLQTMRL